MGDESGVDVVFQDDSIHALTAEHVDVLALLNFVGDVVNSRFFRLFLLVSVFRIFGILRSFSLLFGVLCRSFFFLILVDAVLKSQIFSVDVLEKNIVHHLLGEFLVLDALSLIHILLEFVQTATKNDAVVKLMKEEFGKIEVVRGGSVGIESINVMER